MTSRECLYHLPCEPSARKLDDLGGGWLTPTAAVWPDRVIVHPPAFDDDVGFFPRVAQLPVEPLLTSRVLGDPELPTGVELNRPQMLNNRFGRGPCLGHDPDLPGCGPVSHSRWTKFVRAGQ